MTGRGSAALLAWLLVACDSRALVVGESATSGSVDEQSRAPQPRCPDPAAARVGDDECWPTRHVGLWRGLVTPDPGAGQGLAGLLALPSGEVLLEIEPQGTGTLLFARDAAPGLGCAGDAGVASVADAGSAGESARLDDAGTACAAGEALVAASALRGVALDHRYTLDGLSMSGAPESDRSQDPRVTFTLLVASPWREHCNSSSPELAAAPCRCSAQGCDISPGVMLVSLSLSRDARALRGGLSYTEGDPSSVEPLAGLELVRQ